LHVEARAGVLPDRRHPATGLYFPSVIPGVNRQFTNKEKDMQSLTTEFDTECVLCDPDRFQSRCETSRVILTARQLLEILPSACHNPETGILRTTANHLSNFIGIPIDLMTLDDIVESLPGLDSYIENKRQSEERSE
jgi:hypothetical protein